MNPDQGLRSDCLYGARNMIDFGVFMVKGEALDL